MDPNETLRRIFDTIGEGDSWNEAPSMAQDLLDWMNKGGFQPSLNTDQQRFLLSHFLTDVAREHNI